MSENYLAQYKDEGSESSSLDEDELKGIVKNAGISEQLLEEVKAKTEKKEAAPIPFDALKKKEIVPYDFSKDEVNQAPQAVPTNSYEEDHHAENKNHGLSEKAIPEIDEELMNDPLYYIAAQSSEPISQPKAQPAPYKPPLQTNLYKPVSNPANYYKPSSDARVDTKIDTRAPSFRPTAPISGTSYPSVSTSIINEDPAAARGTQDYKDFAKDFDKEFGNNRMSQKEIDALTKAIEARKNGLANFARELEKADVDMILFKNKLLREISDIQNDLREANSNIIVLMNDRMSMKDQFCLQQVKIKKFKGLNKTLQEDINT